MIATLILAAGQSKRMGQLKQVMPWGDYILLGKTIEIYQRAGVEPILVVVGFEAAKIKKKLANEKVIWIDNLSYQEGMSTSIRAGLRELSGETQAVLLALGDLPLVKPETIRNIISAYKQKKPPIVVPRFLGKKGHPVLVAQSLFPQLLNIRGDKGARNIIQGNQKQVLYLDVDDPGIYWDIDDFQTYEKFRPTKEDSP